MEDLRWPVRFYPRPVLPAVLIERPHDAMLSLFDETDAFGWQSLPRHQSQDPILGNSAEAPAPWRCALSLSPQTAPSPGRTRRTRDAIRK